MRLIDSRRLRGPNLQLPRPAAIAEVALDPGESPPAAEAAWRAELRRVAAALGFDGVDGAVARAFPSGLALAVPAPIDALYAATELNEWAIASATSVLAGGPPADVAEAAARLAEELAQEARPALRALDAAARARGVPMVWDDEAVTLGMGAHAATYPVDALPPPAEVPWASLRAIPVVLVTGTNGKTTSARWIARMVREAGWVDGNTSTDGIAVAGVTVEQGDWTGAEAARRLLRRPDVEVAVLETARGGILRRGLAVDRADAALITNVSADHLGEFGVHDVDTMARAKAVVGRIVAPTGLVVLNAEDPRLVALAPTFAAPVALFSLDAGAPALAAHRAAGGAAFYAEAGALWRAADGRPPVRLAAIRELPLGFDGAAGYNVANALGAAAVAWSLGVPDGAVARALRGFGADENPGRGQVTTLASGARVVRDFGHNPAALAALLAFAGSLRGPAGRLVVVTTSAGDRDDDALAAQARTVVAAGTARAVVWETEHLRRGRAPGETTAIYAAALRAAGLAAIAVADDELAAVDAALAGAGPGDVVVVTPNIDRAGVAARCA